MGSTIREREGWKRGVWTRWHGGTEKMGREVDSEGRSLLAGMPYKGASDTIGDCGIPNQATRQDAPGVSTLRGVEVGGVLKGEGRESSFVVCGAVW